ncbi:MAG: cobaltochelatase subunit CobN [Devosia nanyangense]|uniref:Cobaltochelatase subunit CobN n=1 Tax=Devosia nanyangense TaxID=1228055 RepID=A0A933NXN8_9HYPH|nr:cobaltochelatase subunit CobN [Devosia nanyangense]
MSALAADGRFKLALLPGDATPDPALEARSTVTPEEWARLHALFTAGGPENADGVLRSFARLSSPHPALRATLSPEGRGDPTEVSVSLSPRPSGERVPSASEAGEGPSPFPRFGYWTPSTGIVDELPVSERPAVPLLFYRAALEGAGTATLEALCTEIGQQGLAPVPLMISTLKEGACIRFVKAAFAAHTPQAILNLTGFALGLDGLEDKLNPFAGTDAPVIQLVQGGRPEAQWAADSQGLTAKDLAMQVVLPELDGRIGGIIVGHKAESVWHAATECPLSAYAPDADGIRRAVALAKNWVRLRATPRSERRVGIVLANYPIRDGRLANGVGYDAPESTVEILRLLASAGYGAAVPWPSPLVGEGAQGANEGEAPASAQATHPSSVAARHLLPQGVKATTAGSANWLIELLQAGPTNACPERGQGVPFPLARYREVFATLPEKVRREVTARWGEPEADPFVRGAAFHLPALVFGNVVVLLQPARGYDRGETAAYHDPDLVPPHAYLAAYLWLKHEFGAHALIHNGKHGSLEWLPGKANALDGASYPAALWGELPQLYPFIVNDPGEGTQAKRRTGAVIIDHLVPPLTRAETYGPLKDLEALLDEYYAASGMDRRRLKDLRKRILDFTRDARLDRDIGLPEDETAALRTIDTFLCDLKEAQIRDGLHVFGQSPTGRLERDLIVALARVPRGDTPGDASLIRSLADDLKLAFDPLTADLGEPWTGPPPPPPAAVPFPRFTGEDQGEIAPQRDPPPRGGGAGPATPADGAAPRTVGDVVEYLEALASELVEGRVPDPNWQATRAVLRTVETTIRPRLAASGPAEIASLLLGLDGKFIAAGPSGAPSRGRLDVLPTGRNFYSVDNRAIPTPTAWELGKKSAETLLLRHFQDHGTHLRALALSVWGTSTMRTGGDDIAQALAFIGARPVWDPSSLRLSGYEIIPLAKLGRPRVDVTLRISGLFRDAFPQQIALFDRAVRAIGALDEPEDQNPVSARMRSDALGLMKDGASEADAAMSAGHRIFGSKPGAYGAGLQALIDSGNWTSTADLGEAFLNWGQYAYGAHAAGTPERSRFAARLGDIEAVVHNQDNREHDLLDSDDYYQFEGGLVATAEAVSGRRPVAYHNDHSRPERPKTRTLEEEISHVMRSRVVNPKWIDGVKRHGYKGAFEIIATVDYMFAFAATTGAVKTHHFDLAFEAFVEDGATREFIRENNRFGYDELIAKFNEARERGYWMPRSNRAGEFLKQRMDHNA